MRVNKERLESPTNQIESPKTTEELGNREDSRTPNWSQILVVILSVILLGVGGVLFLVYQEIRGLKDDVGRLEHRSLIQVSDLAGLSGRVQSMEDALSGLGDIGGSPVVVPEGSLAQHDPSLASDPATGTQLGDVVGIDWGSETEISISPRGDLPTLWLLVAHWCPHCQYQLPTLNGIWETLPHDSVRTVVISTAQNEAGGGEEDDWLSSGDFQFPVMIDTGNRLATQFGASAFPFWVVTDPNGIVMGRFAGRTEEPAITQLYEDMLDLGSE